MENRSPMSTLLTNLDKFLAEVEDRHFGMQALEWEPVSEEGSKGNRPL